MGSRSNPGNMFRIPGEFGHVFPGFDFQHQYHAPADLWPRIPLVDAQRVDDLP